ncbi:hypothetical protein [Streptomyces sp. NPDC001933]|uniref:hypothetical protein n=1 Tax=Streptomyces sp. NPDC001933 TaxID=3364626 RepID=UPI003693BAC2
MSTTTTTGPTEAAELRSLFRSGRLAAAYPDLPRLLKELSDDRLLPAGQLLSRIEADDAARFEADGRGTLLLNTLPRRTPSPPSRKTGFGVSEGRSC